MCGCAREGMHWIAVHNIPWATPGAGPTIKMHRQWHPRSSSSAHSVCAVHCLPVKARQRFSCALCAGRTIIGYGNGNALLTHADVERTDQKSNKNRNEKKKRKNVVKIIIHIERRDCDNDNYGTMINSHTLRSIELLCE